MWDVHGWLTDEKEKYGSHSSWRGVKEGGREGGGSCQEPKAIKTKMK